jgi:hypothetical protein
MYFPGIDSPLSPLVSISGWTYSPAMKGSLTRVGKAWSTFLLTS